VVAVDEVLAEVPPVEEALLVVEETMPLEVVWAAVVEAPTEVVLTEAPLVELPMAEVGADIRLPSVALKVPVIPVKVNLAEKPS